MLYLIIFYLIVSQVLIKQFYRRFLRHQHPLDGDFFWKPFFFTATWNQINAFLSKLFNFLLVGTSKFFIIYCTIFYFDGNKMLTPQLLLQLKKTNRYIPQSKTESTGGTAHIWVGRWWGNSLQRMNKRLSVQS